MFPGEEHLAEPIFEVLAYALSLDSTACRESALHGLGRCRQYQSARVDAAGNTRSAAGSNGFGDIASPYDAA
jgi:hypothetical protein